MEQNTTKIQTLNDQASTLKKEEKDDLTIDFTTSSAISKVSVKFLVIYIPIFWFSGMLVGIYLYEYFKNLPPFTEDWIAWIPTLLFLPWAFFCCYMIFIIGCLIFSKLFLILINLIHNPKEGIFRAEKGDTDFEFWCLRREIKKLVLWLMRNCPLPWVDAAAFRWFGVKIDFSSHLQDSWCDVEFIKFGRKVMIGQGAVVMSSMVIGKYLIIRKVIFGDYTVVGGQATIAPGTITGTDSLLGAISSTIFNQILEPGWIYFGIPSIKLKPNELATNKTILKRIVDEEKKIEMEHDIVSK
ncbi:MAG: hypothetical protein GF353_16335 [Candidatus Lokiarchaeota archaeon]|nr:hypothetical protein [Candidatus Lokiarchaeota archaeon]